MPQVQATRDYFKFCPGEEHVKISNAICRGRRRSHFPKCPGCQFNDDEKDQGRETQSQERLRSLSQVESLFRISDARAAYPIPLSLDAAWRVGHASAQYLHGKLRAYDRADPSAKCLVVGRDTRASSQPICEAMIEGVRASGMDVIDIGVVDTPQVYFAVNHFKACGGIEITGSEDGPDINGFKFCNAKTLPIAIDTGLTSIRDLATRVPKHPTGMTAKFSQSDLRRAYVPFLHAALKGTERSTRRLKIVVDASNGVAGKWITPIFESLDRITVVPMNFEHEGIFTHEPSPLLSSANFELRRIVKELEADLGVCFDADASSCAFVDDKAALAPHDLLCALMGRRLLQREPSSNFVLDVRASAAVAEEIGRAGGVVLPERIGEPSMKKTMSGSSAVLGADLDGRFYFRDGFFCESGFLALLHVVAVLLDADKKLSDLLRPIQRYRVAREVIFRNPNRDDAIRQLADAHPDGEMMELSGLRIRYPDWWIHVRPGVGKDVLLVNIETRTRKALDQKLAELKPILGERLSPNSNLGV
jgi:phosphomannomutase